MKPNVPETVSGKTTINKSFEAQNSQSFFGSAYNNKKKENDARLPNFDKTTTKKRETKLRKKKTDTTTTTKNRKCAKINIKKQKTPTR